MRVDIVGGGPAGLFLAVLLRRDGTADEVNVFERDGPDRTGGWGLVFPEGALNELERVDPPTFAAVVSLGTTWTPVDIRFRSTRRLLTGNSFHGIPRIALLDVLQEAATRLGARLHFGHRIHDLADHRDADLVVGADGVNSVVRRERQRVFQPRIEHSRFRYRWLGVDRVFPYFTYIFRDTEWGLFQGYCYPSGRSWSSMIIYVSTDTWERAGLAALDDGAALELCERVFAPELDGRRLLPRDSQWTSFAHVRCRTWHDRDAVLIGDAAHTAHWSIGSGTRLAIGDAVALARELRARPRVLADALARFEESRRDTVEKVQAAARLSERYFDNLRRYLGFEPVQFAYQLMARSWRITHQDIARLNPDFVARFDAWFHSRASGVATEVAPSPAFAPMRVGALHLRNRVVTTDGAAGSGLVITRAGASPTAGGDGPDGCYPRPDTPPACLRLDEGMSPDGCAKAARVALDHGYAMVMVDLSGRPAGELSGPPAQVPEAVSAVRAEWPAGHPVAVALGVGSTSDVAAESAAMVAVARSLAGAGVDILLLEAATAGSEGPAADGVRVVQVADAIRNEAGVAVIADGATGTIDELDTIIGAGWADLAVWRRTTDAGGTDAEA